MSAIQTLYQSSKPLIIADAPPQQVNKLEPGQRIQATIQEQVSPGLFKVQVDGQLLQLRLPAQLQVGSKLDLKIESNSPRLTFSFYASSNPISTQEQISATSRFVANMAELPLTRTLIESAPGKAVWQAGGTNLDTKQLAGALREALANSGLFYESHQAQWVRGERSTAQLLIEPQNQIQDKNIQTTDTTAYKPSDSTTTASGLSIELRSMVQQQLHTLETHQLTWSGEIWPNQHMQWEIQGQPEQHAQRPDERQWSTEMELALNRLGDVHARLVYTQGAIKLTLHAADAKATELLNRRLPALRNTLQEAGINLTSAVIEKT
jgi:flagellar hook-length control protein FliK